MNHPRITIKQELEYGIYTIEINGYIIGHIPAIQNPQRNDNIEERLLDFTTELYEKAYNQGINDTQENMRKSLGLEAINTNYMNECDTRQFKNIPIITKKSTNG